MSKFSTRKSLGFAAVLALGASLFSGVAANAVAAPSLTAAYGDNAKNHVLVGSDYALIAENANGGAVNGTFTFTNEGSLDTNVYYDLYTTSSFNADGTPVWDNSWDSISWTTLSPGAQLTYSVTGNTDSDILVALNSAAADSHISVKFQQGASASATSQVYFDGAATAGLKAGAINAIVGTASLSSTWTLNSNINVDQVAWSLNDGGSYGGGDIDSGYKEGAGVVTSWNFDTASVDASGALKVTYNHTPAEGETYSAALESDIYPDGWTTLDTAIVYGHSVNPVTHAVSAPVGAINANVTHAINDDYTAVRKGTKTVDVSAKATDVDGNAVAGKDALVTLSKDTTLAGSVTAGGKTLTNTSGSVSFHATTDADGKVSFTLTNSSAAAGEEINIEVQVEGKTNDGDFGWEAATYVLGDAVVNNNGTADHTVVAGSSFTVAYEVHDQWGLANPGANYKVSLARSVDTARYAAATWNFDRTAIASTGVVNFAVTDDGSGVGADDLAADLWFYNGTSWSSIQTENDVLSYDLAVAVAATKVTASAYSTDTSRVPTTDVSAYRAFNQQFPDAEYNAGWCGMASDLVYGVATNATGDEIDGALVTVSAADAFFYTNGGDGEIAGAKNTLSEYTIDGNYGFVVCSNKPGKQTVTVTVGGVTKTVDVYFLSTQAKTVALSVNAGSASAQSGRSVAVSATVKDANGYLVPDRVVTFTTTGLGTLDAATATTDANGVATVHYLTGVAETGSVDFVATVKAADATNKAVEQVDAVASAKSTVSFIRANGAVTHKGKTVTAKWSAAAGQKVIVTVDGYRRYTQVELTDGANSFAKKLKKGRHVINLYIGGVLVDSLKFTIKK